MVGADRHLGRRLAVVESRPDADGHPRQPCDWLDPPDELRRTEDAFVAAEARHEIGDAHGAAALVAQNGFDDSGIADIGRLMLDDAIEQHVAKALFLVAGNQPGKNRIAVEAWR